MTTENDDAPGEGHIIELEGILGPSAGRALRAALEQVPNHMREGLAAYVVAGQPPGDFLRAVLSNDLRRASLRADASNRRRLADWGLVLSQLPAACEGGSDKVARWISAGGIRGGAHLPEEER